MALKTADRVPVALTIAGSDSGGGAGIQADLKTFSALDVFGTTVITAITAQNTQTVQAVHAIPADMVTAQIAALESDIPPDAIKIGMLADPDVIGAVATGLSTLAAPIVLDPVMVAKSGDALLRDDAVTSLVRDLLPRATVLTPNLPEAARMLDTSEADCDDAMIAQGMALFARGPKAILMKGGHGSGDTCSDILIGRDGVLGRWTAARIVTRNTHGTGCTLSAAIAAGLARGLDLVPAVAAAHAYLQRAIRAADGLNIGSGHGPVHHFHAQWAQAS